MERRPASPAIPPEVYNWYDSHLNGETYRAFRRLLDDYASEAAIPLLMSMLTDAALERSGAQYYAGMTAYLYEQLARCTCGGAPLFVAAEEHLRRFNRYIEEQPQARLKADGRTVPASRIDVSRPNGGKR
jgi:hypothetical protein